MLSDVQITRFIRDGFLKIENAFPRALADEARAILWRDTGCDPARPETWTSPVIRLGMYPQPPFTAAANTPVLRAAFDQLCGSGGWRPCASMGTFPVRFPSPEDPGDTGWHIDVSFGLDVPDFMEWRANVYSRGRALLMLFLFSDVEECDAPTRIKIGSHMNVARLLAPAGEAGLTLRELVAAGFGDPTGAETLATGAAGTVYLCHPFLVHSAQKHCGSTPRFMAQPPLLPARPMALEARGEGVFPVERAILNAILPV